MGDLRGYYHAALPPHGDDGTVTSAASTATSSFVIVSRRIAKTTEESHVRTLSTVSGIRHPTCPAMTLT